MVIYLPVFINTSNCGRLYNYESTDSYSNLRASIWSNFRIFPVLSWTIVERYISLNEIALLGTSTLRAIWQVQLFLRFSHLRALSIYLYHRYASHRALSAKKKEKRRGLQVSQGKGRACCNTRRDCKTKGLILSVYATNSVLSWRGVNANIDARSFSAVSGAFRVE